MKEIAYKRRLEDVERAVQKVDPANTGFSGSAIAEYLNSKYDGPRSNTHANRKLNSRGAWATGTAVSNILRAAHYPYVKKSNGKTYFHRGTNTDEMQKEHNERVDRWANKPKFDDYIEPFIRYWTDDALSLEDIAKELGVAAPTVLNKFRRLEESSTYGHYPVQYKERTGYKRKFTRRKKKERA
jgi:hypothetical protein